MTDTTPHRATAEELRSRIEALEGSYETMRLAALEWGKDVDRLMRWSDQHLQRIEKLEAGATCPHIASSDEGTSYCGLAEQQAAAPPEPAPDGSLVDCVDQAIAIAGDDASTPHWAPEARAAIREVADRIEQKQIDDYSVVIPDVRDVIEWLREEVER